MSEGVCPSDHFSGDERLGPRRMSLLSVAVHVTGPQVVLPCRWWEVARQELWNCGGKGDSEGNGCDAPPPHSRHGFLVKGCRLGCDRSSAASPHGSLDIFGSRRSRTRCRVCRLPLGLMKPSQPAARAAPGGWTYIHILTYTPTILRGFGLPTVASLCSHGRKRKPVVGDERVFHGQSPTTNPVILGHASDRRPPVHRCYVFPLVPFPGLRLGGENPPSCRGPAPATLERAKLRSHQFLIRVGLVLAPVWFFAQWTYVSSLAETR